MSVLVTGATGYIAQHIITDLLEQNYKVIGTVRSESKGDNLVKLFNSNNFTYEVVPDISVEGAFDKVLEKNAKDIKYVLHTASPVVFEVEDLLRDIVDPAVYGTKGILNSIKKYGSKTVERVVITSSVAAIEHPDGISRDGKTITEKDWCPLTLEDAKLNSVNAYFVSKTLAERAAWEFYEENKKSGDIIFKLATVNPAYVFGPQTFDTSITGQLNFSCEIVNKVLQLKPTDKVNTNITGRFIDVRDVSKAHLLAFQKENTIEKRLVVSSELFGDQEMVNILNEKFPTLRGKIPPVGKSDELAANNLQGLIDMSETRKILGFEYISLDKSVYDTAAQILKAEGKI
ncbi:hypothetical protein TBLA_0C03420 [Henningerozyma blattae CBS 6284]|uniref:NAD-dependent epimerase/dehydratase domain-containing protein n=1 Tax=Henningerozyma blattae (strain ATCC 34711 / CBS 6284 / DSM 70876 / NBRC 10599 / NRRL Y-10934 / UCD 77-7) TaxID=1071380 RepID=I2H193_HENB6|nr:hypothetical protein TBLA_0C03420 [Tetrapisispora blattae CBS 6284]CCH60145.1 hypothetical protein TBLA_0C03420 [Tetrapisispora blattae CBS 6284]